MLSNVVLALLLSLVYITRAVEIHLFKTDPDLGCNKDIHLQVKTCTDVEDQGVCCTPPMLITNFDSALCTGLSDHQLCRATIRDLQDSNSFNACECGCAVGSAKGPKKESCIGCVNYGGGKRWYKLNGATIWPRDLNLFPLPQPPSGIGYPFHFDQPPLPYHPPPPSYGNPGEHHIFQPPSSGGAHPLPPDNYYKDGYGIFGGYSLDLFADPRSPYDKNQALTLIQNGTCKYSVAPDVVTIGGHHFAVGKKHGTPRHIANQFWKLFENDNTPKLHDIPPHLFKYHNQSLLRPMDQREPVKHQQDPLPERPVNHRVGLPPTGKIKSRSAHQGRKNPAKGHGDHQGTHALHNGIRPYPKGNHPDQKDIHANGKGKQHIHKGSHAVHKKKLASPQGDHTVHPKGHAGRKQIQADLANNPDNTLGGALRKEAKARIHRKQARARRKKARVRKFVKQLDPFAKDLYYHGYIRRPIYNNPLTNPYFPKWPIPKPPPPPLPLSGGPPPPKSPKSPKSHTQPKVPKNNPITCPDIKHIKYFH